MGIRQPPAGSPLVLVKVFSQHVWWKGDLCLMLFITVAADFLKVKKHQSVCTAFEGCQSEDLTWVPSFRLLCYSTLP